MSTKSDLIKRLAPFSQGCFSGKISEWPQLKPLLKDVYEYLCTRKDASQCAVAADALCSCKKFDCVIFSEKYCPVCGKPVRR